MTDGPTDNYRISGVYFARAVESGRIKIGFSVDANKRLRSLQTGCSERLELIRVVEGDAELERALHLTFATERRHGEWFEPSSRLLAYIASTNWNVFEATSSPKLWTPEDGDLRAFIWDLVAQGEADFVTLYKYAFDCFDLGWDAYQLCANAWRLEPETGPLGKRTLECLLCPSADGTAETFGHVHEQFAGQLDSEGDDIFETCPLLRKLATLPPLDRARAQRLMRFEHVPDDFVGTRCVRTFDSATDRPCSSCRRSLP